MANTRHAAALYDSFAEVYDLQHRHYLDDLPMYLRLAREAGPSACILEIGCGSGRLLVPLLEAGWRVVGVDESAAMLRIAAARLASLPQPIGHRGMLVRADARKLALTMRFDLAIIALNTFLHNLSRESQLAMLRAARQHLKPSALLVVDLPPNDELAWQPDDGQFHHEATLVDPAAKRTIQKYVASRVFWSTQEQELTYRLEVQTPHAPPQEHLYVVRVRHVFRYEMELLLLSSGFEAPRWAGNYDLTPYGEGSPRMIALARAV
ncbi:MAG: class I SAM-dependent methyltransferase [Thermoflexales bacterium]|nr:class I SAM-dependent methyltransferase [Thermoflexales bacterium]MCS7325625.1 class I SAM-dependent methyltransferase [Thermoflexales bacterium]MCX7938260.1 class I SAM-dependent methyltransferase [Thermoflexales bacterium]MDW8054356.1 class I SAM-dependent methyltransferase [Anaerolineae bacterium]MDW8291482.1 class I SAM-dependent methyltransferase [Anaerolineae bacterium]